MQKIFQYIRRQPKSVRDSYAFGIATVFTAVVLMVWVVARPNESNDFFATASKSTSTSPFATLIKESKEKLAKVKSSITKTAENNAGVAAAISASSSPSEMVLSAEDIEIAKQDLETSSSSEPEPEELKATYYEVLIGTTSASVSVDSKGSKSSATASTTAQ